MEGCVRAAQLSLEHACQRARRVECLVPKPTRDEHGETVAHAFWMGLEIIDGRVTGNKAHRWLGYLQGILVCQGWCTLEQMKEASRQAAEEERA